MRQRLASLFAASCLALLFVAVAGGSAPFDLLGSWRNRVEDLRWRWLAPLPSAAPVVVVDIDDASLANIGFWPWPRERVAQLARLLFDKYRVAVVGLDILYPEPSSQPAVDHAFGEVGRRYPLVFPQAFNFSPDQPWLTGQLPAGMACPRAPALTGYGGLALSASLGTLPYVGHISPIFDPDGILRRAAPLIRYRGQCYPSLSLAMLAALANTPSHQIALSAAASQSGAELTWLAEPALGIRLPLQRDGTLTIPWRAQLPAVVSAQDILLGRADAALLHNSVVLVGSSAAGLGDLVATPRASNLPGVMVHAVLIEAMLDGRWQARPGWAPGAVLLFTALFAWLLLNERITRAPWRSLLIALAGAGLWLLLDLLAWRQGHDLPLLPPLLCLLAQLPVQAAWQGFRAQQAQRRLFHQFSAYLPHDVLQQLIKSGADPRKLHAQRRDISVLFVDVVGFTRLAETLPPEAVARLLNIVMDHLAKLVHAHNGTLDKFIGDALMAFWGAPLAQPDHADLSLACGQAMLAALPDINRALHDAGLPAVQVGIGINSGPAAVGNLGSQERRAYSAVGDTVNLAARLETLTRQLHEPLLLGEGTCRLLRRGAIVPLGRFALRGRGRPLLVGRPL